MLKRVIAVVVVAVGLSAAPAAAQQYPPAPNQLAVSDTCVPAGAQVTLSASTFTPGSTVSFSVGEQQLGTAVAADNGVATFVLTVPAGTSGDAQVAATGEGTGGPLTVESVITVGDDECAPAPAPAAPAPSDDAGGGALPETGSESTVPLFRIGLALAAAGGLLLALTAKRRRLPRSA
jgi:LPXTG-motif cell wall-anchored protein